MYIKYTSELVTPFPANNFKSTDSMKWFVPCVLGLGYQALLRRHPLQPISWMFFWIQSTLGFLMSFFI